MVQREEWNGFKTGRLWQDEVNVREFIQLNYTPYDGDSSFLAGPTAATNELFGELQRLQKEEHNKKCTGLDGKERSGVLDLDTDIVSTITSPAVVTVGKDTLIHEAALAFQVDCLI